MNRIEITIRVASVRKVQIRNSLVVLRTTKSLLLSLFVRRGDLAWLQKTYQDLVQSNKGLQNNIRSKQNSQQ